jgi:hypothetical protein
MIQIDGLQRTVYVKFLNNERMLAVLQPVKGPLEYHHENGELSLLQMEIAGLGVKRVRIANLPPETSDRAVRDTLSKMAR